MSTDNLKLLTQCGVAGGTLFVLYGLGARALDQQEDMQDILEEQNKIAMIQAEADKKAAEASAHLAQHMESFFLIWSGAIPKPNP